MENVYYNLSAIASRERSLFECRLAHIDEAAHRLAELSLGSGSLSENEALRAEYERFVSEAFVGDAHFPSDVPPENAPRVRACIGDEAVNSRIFLCAAIVEKRRQMGAPLSLKDFFGDTEIGEDGARIAYIRNTYSEAAFREFSRVIKDPAVSYPRDFNGACEEVYYGRSTYCILPAETSDEGTLTGFRRLAAKYELAPVLSCSVSTGEAQTTRFVLFSKKPETVAVENENAAAGCRRIFLFRLDAPDGQSVTRTVKALDIYGLKLLKIDSSPVSWDEGRYSLDVSAECGDGDILALLTYLTLEIPEYTPIGIYTQLADGRSAE